MATGKNTYSHITLDIAEDDEAIRVDSQGVHRQHPSSLQEGAASRATADEEPAAYGVGAHTAAASAAEASSPSAPSDGEEAASKPAQDPLPGMHKGIVAALVLFMVAFIVYFFVMHG